MISHPSAPLAQSVECESLTLKVAVSSPTSCAHLLHFSISHEMNRNMDIRNSDRLEGSACSSPWQNCDSRYRGLTIWLVLLILVMFQLATNKRNLSRKLFANSQAEPNFRTLPVQKRESSNWASCVRVQFYTNIISLTCNCG
jgi:hypothetical protein